MQILNISVMNRPSKSITSRPYAAESLESIGFTVYGVDGHQSNYNMLEGIVYSAGMSDGTIRELLNKLPTDPEAMSWSAGMGGLQITYEVVYKKYSLQPEQFKWSASIGELQITREVRYLGFTMDTSSMDWSAGIGELQITK